MKANISITPETVRFLLDYKDGILYWKNILSVRVKIGDRAGTINKDNGRYSIAIGGIRYMSSRLIFLYHHGYLPECVDHIDRDCTNDKIENLRGCSIKENNRNTSSHKDSTSQYLGVSLCIKRWKYSIKKGVKHRKPIHIEKWIARICVDGKGRQIGLFDTQEEAALAYNREAVKHFREFANLNIIKP